MADKPAKKTSDGCLRNHAWPRFLSGPDTDLLEKLYVPALSEAIRYDRCCAYFSSSVLSAAARGYAGMIRRLLDSPDCPRPAIRLIVNEEMASDDVKALMETGDTQSLEDALRKRFKSPRDLLEKERLAMLAWLVKSEYLAIRVGVMRHGQGIMHAKFGLVYDIAGDAVVFSGSGNETAQGLLANYERLEVSASWNDEERLKEYETEFADLWNNSHSDVHTVTLPEAIKRNLVRFAPPEPPIREPSRGLEREKAAMIWQFISEAAYLPNGASCCEATAPIESLWPHQQRVVEEVCAAWPNGRLLCDEVGMGKTIEAIMVLRRLLAGRGVQRALLLLPAGLTIQWQEELREKGGLIIPRLFHTDKLIWPDGRTENVDDLACALDRDLLIMSRETARTGANRDIILMSRPWDLVILDEAHAARRAKQEQGEFNSATLLLELLRQMQATRKARSFIFLSATPMQTSPWEPWDLLAVLGEGGPWTADFESIRAYYGVMRSLQSGETPDPVQAKKSAWLISSDERFSQPPRGLRGFSNPEDGERILRFVPAPARAEAAQWMRRGSPLVRRMHRNTKRTIQQYYQAGMLEEPPCSRIVIDCPYDFEPVDGRERNVYNAVGQYIDRRFEELEREKPGKGFVMTIYRRRAASSFHALRCSLQRRLANLKRVAGRRAISDFLEYDDTPDAAIDMDLPEDMDAGAISASLPATPEEAIREMEEVEQLINRLDALGSVDTKRDRFFELIRTLMADGRPALVFTEYADTLKYLRSSLADFYGPMIGSFCGEGGSVPENGSWPIISKKQITDALFSGTARILVCTDAASEGLNLQAASAIVNYDLPWNPSRVEQRIGRIDRIGQKQREVKVYNFFLKNSIDEHVYTALEGRCGLFKHFVGPMQPVLARARSMLQHPHEFSFQELEAIAAEAENNTISAEAYLDSEAVPEPAQAAPVSKNDIIEALTLLKDESVVNVTRTGNIFTVQGLGPKPIKLTMDREVLDAAPDLAPLTILDDTVRKIAGRLETQGECTPLVISSSSDGAFRCSYAVWIGPDSLEPLCALDDLRIRLAEWDGRFADAARYASAVGVAKRNAEIEVRRMKENVEKAERASMSAQLLSARIRLARELGRLLISLDMRIADLKSALASYALQGGPLALKLSEASARLGSGYTWDAYLQWEIRQFVAGLSDTERRSRLMGSSLDAALDDYRWRIGEKRV
jgi:superfamily II DNA or RNA helicase